MCWSGFSMTHRRLRPSLGYRAGRAFSSSAPGPATTARSSDRTCCGARASTPGRFQRLSSRTIRDTLRLRAAVVHALDRLHLERVVHFVGGGPAHATALEGALKLREASYLSAEGHELESILHGPLISLTAEDSVVLVAQPGPAMERMTELAEALHEIGTPTLAVGPTGVSLKATVALETPTIDERLAPIVNVVPLQWLALEVSRRLGVDADSFRKVGRYAAAQSKFIL